MAVLTSARISADPGAGASVVSTTTWNVRDMGGDAAGSLGLDEGSMIGTTTNDVRSAAIFGGVGVSSGLAGLRTPKASSAVVAGNELQ
ncbi:hypothetical protein PVL29_015955 [Vitis rotundifolia]|uniref:Uncharacterized protein n=1 Tax=Vitis rotundifolia TaxID=103349 RepID=A0AA39DJL9_VITRO|nr:hypothetical protein PVL29_015924 [Vitis rotundifolia]KAJ9687278.1 hypothetical protein PVL29_015955 [Vitis rotundifolia]